MSFWGVEVKPSKPYVYPGSVSQRVHITQATLGSGYSTKKSTLQCNVGEKSPIFVCTLFPEKSECCQLNLEIEDGNEITFSVIGPRSVHLSGFSVNNDGEADEDCDSFEDIEETESEESTDYSSEEYEDSFVVDDDFKDYSLSPICKSGVVIEEILDDEKSKNEDGNLIQPSAEPIDSEDEDGLLISAEKADNGEKDDSSGSKLRERNMSDAIVEPRSKRKRMKKKGTKHNESEKDDNHSGIPKDSILPECKTAELVDSEDEDGLPISVEKNNEDDTRDKGIEEGDGDDSNAVKLGKKKMDDHILVPGNKSKKGKNRGTRQKVKKLDQRAKVGVGNLEENGINTEPGNDVPLDNLHVDDVIHDVDTTIARDKTMVGKAEVDRSKENGINTESGNDVPLVNSHVDDAIHDVGMTIARDKTMIDEAAVDRRKENGTDTESGNVVPLDNLHINDAIHDVEATMASEDNERRKKKRRKKNRDKTMVTRVNGEAEIDRTKEDKKKDNALLVAKNEGKSLQVRTFGNGMVVEELVMGKPDGKKASPGKKVSVYYVGKLKKNGAIFDSNIGKTPFNFRLGVNTVIKGWDVGVNGMRVGDRRRLTIPPSMGYGHKLVGSIPENSWLMFDVELVDVR